MRYGFVGLGQMGYPMAMNLLRKTTSQSSFTIYDVNPLSLSRFVNEASTISGVPTVSVAHTPKDLAERSVPPLMNCANGRTQ
jgi:3-hydroxyisobutyrate/3-hydroxypropionate dehydrogenase